MGDVLDHLGCVILPQVIMLDDDVRMMFFFQNSHELEGREASPDLQLR